MKQRILVMNGHRLVQSEQGKDWITTKVGKAGHIQPGIYHISGAVQASRDKAYAGVVLHTDPEHVYQLVGKLCVRHSAADFPKIPAVGTSATIRYDADQAMADQVGIKQGRGVKR